jgi:hypothetical protein
MALVEHLARAIFTFARHRPGRLAAVSVRIPMAAADIRDALSTRLQAFGIDDAVVHVQRRPGDPALVSVEYER